MNFALIMPRVLKKHWFLVYFVLAAFDLVAIAATLYINHINLKDYSKIVESNLSTVEILESAGELLSAAQKTNAPGNDVFDSQNVVSERTRFSQKTLGFEKQINKLSNLILKGERTSTEETEFSNQIENIRQSMNEMQVVETEISKHFESKNQKKAAALMAEMDRKYATLLQNIEHLRQSQIQKQSQLLVSHKKKLEVTQKKELLYSLIVFFIILSVAYYGGLISRFVKDSYLRDAQLAGIVSSSKDAIISKNSEGKISSWNAGAEKMFGFSEEEVNGKFLNQIFPNWVNQNGPMNPKGQSTGESLISLFDKNGKKLEVSFRVSSLFDPKGIKNGESIIIRDMTEIKNLEHSSKQILEALDQSAIVAFTDSNGKITQVNDNFCKISGYSREELLGKDHRIVNSGKHSKWFFKEMWADLRAGRTWTGDIENKTKDGNLYIVRSVITPIKNVEGKIEKFMAVRFDVTDQKLLEKKLVEAQEIAKIGSWKYDVKTKSQEWTSEHYKIFEILEPQPPEDLFRLYRERIHPEDRSKLDAVMAKALETGSDFVFDHRVCLDSGKRTKYVRGAGKIQKDSNGNILSISGTCQDLTELVSLQEQNKMILETMGIGIWKFNPQLNALEWDSSLYKLYDLDPKDFSGDYQAWESTLTPEAKQNVVEELGQALRGEKEFDTSFEIVTRSGLKKEIGGRGIVLRNSRREPLMMYGVNWDRTNEAKNQRELKATLDLNEAIQRSANFAIITTTLEGIITGFNKEAERILGYSAAEMIQKQSPGVFHDPIEVMKTAKKFSEELGFEVPVGFETFVVKARGGRGKFDERNWTYIRKDGTRVPVRLNVTGLYDSENKLYGFLAIAKDISQEVALHSELELERMKSLRNAKLASLGEMSAGIAHEINNPLAIISGSLGLLHKAGSDPKKLAARIEAIQKSCDRISRIVLGLKKFSRSDSKSNFEDHELGKIVSEAMILTESKSRRHETPVSVEIKSQGHVFCDEVEIEQVLVNMINNAIDAVKERPEKWVKVKLFEENGATVLQIMDSGPGIPEPIRAKLFEPFFTTKKIGEGTGLGLSITKGILDEHKATISVVASCPNTCFEIRFPAAEALKYAA